MRLPLMLISLVVLLPSLVASQPLSLTVESFNRISQKVVDPQTDYANGSGKEEYGDAPWVTRNGNIPVVFVVKDANENPMCLNYLRLYRNVGAARTLVAQDATARTINADQTFWTVDLTTSLFGAAVGDTILFEWELSFKDNFCFSAHLNHYFNRVLVGQPLPTLSGWRRVDTHVHGQATDNVYEFGGHFGTMVKAAQSIGLETLCLTDHSTDLTSADWDSLKARSSRFTTSNFLLIPGEELTLDSNESNNTPDDRIHLLAVGLTRRLPAPEECCTDNANLQLWTLRQGLDSVAVQGGVAMAAHPSENYSVGFGGSLAVWSASNWAVGYTYPALIASEFFNERKTMLANSGVTEDFIYPFNWQLNPSWEASWQDGMSQYLGLLQTHLSPLRPLALAGGSDAHGDLNYKTTNQYGTVDLSANDDALGKIHTLVYAPSGLTQANILNGMRQGAIVMSDGPLAAFSIDADGSGTFSGVGSEIVVTANAIGAIRLRSIAEFGTWSSARLIRVSGAAIDTASYSVGGLSFDLEIPPAGFAPTSGWSAVVLEARTNKGYRSVASPIYIAPQGAVAVEPLPERTLRLSESSPNPTTGQTGWTVELPSQQSIELTVTDVRGRTVAVVWRGLLPGGEHRFSWDGRDDRGRAVPSGVYFVRLATAIGEQTQKTLFLR